MSRRYPIEDRELGEWFQREQDDIAERAARDAFEQLALWKSAVEVVLIAAFLGLVCWAVA